MSEDRKRFTGSAIDAYAWGQAMNSPDVRAAAAVHESVKDAIFDPAFNEAFDKAYIKAHDDACADPISRERQEANRLLELVKKRYSVPGLEAEYIGEKLLIPTQDEAKQPGFVHPVRKGLRARSPGGGWWQIPDETPADLSAVFRLHSCIQSIDKGGSEVTRLFAAKHLVAHLRAAQESCGENPEPWAISTMSQDEWEIVAMLYAMDACNATWATDIDTILQRFRNIDMSDSHKTRQRQLRQLREKNIVLTEGKVSKMKYYLSPVGQTCGEYLIHSCRVVLMST